MNCCSIDYFLALRATECTEVCEGQVLAGMLYSRAAEKVLLAGRVSITFWVSSFRFKF